MFNQQTIDSIADFLHACMSEYNPLNLNMCQSMLAIVKLLADKLDKSSVLLNICWRTLFADLEDH